MKQISLFIALMLLTASSLLAQRNITGTIRDENNEPVIGANVVVKGSEPVVGTTTDFNGAYSLKVPAGLTTLTVTYIGYSDQDVEIGVNAVVDVQLSVGVELEALVVTALGVGRQEKSLGYSVTNVDGGRVARSGEVNAVQGLSAKSSGVLVVGSGGTPGASSKILIRGNSTFSGENQPLIVVDGVPFDNQTNATSAGDNPYNANLDGVNNSNRGLDLNPDDIESINVLKGPAASALYGSRAASGVLVITTKKGKARKGGLNVSVSSSLALDKVNKLPARQFAYGQGSGGGGVDSLGNPVPGGTFSGLNTPNNWGPATTETFDNADAYFKTGVTYNNNVAISGGNELATFRLSYGNVNQTGIVPNTKLQRNTIRLSGNMGTEKLNFSGEVAYTNTIDRKAQNGSNVSGVMLSLMRMPVDFNIIGGDGANGYDNADGSSYNYFANYDNPLWTAYNNVQSTAVNRATTRLTANYKPLSWLEFTYRIGLDNYSDIRRQIFAKGARAVAPSDGELWENALTHTEINSDFLVTLKKDFNKFTTSLLLGNNLNHRKDRNIFARGRNLTIPDFYNMSNATDLYSSEVTEIKRIAGLFFNADIGYNNMLYLTVSGRQDYASTFGANVRSKGFFYPSASMSFVFSEVLPQNNVLSFGKARFAYASSGREPSAYRTQTYFTKPLLADGWLNAGIGYPFNGQNGFGYSSVLGNSDLKPEVVTGIEGGVDLKFWNGRVNLALTYYNQTASNILVDRPISSATGFRFYPSNSGKMVNKGIELELNGDIIKGEGDNFNWNMNINFTRNRNEVLALADGVSEFEPEVTFGDPTAYAIVGQPYGILYGSRWLRNPDGKIICDADGYPLIDPVNGPVGNPYPDWTMGINNTFSYKGISLSFLMDIRQGGEQWGGTVARMNRIGASEESGARNQTYVVPNSVIEQPDGSFIENTVPLSAIDYFQNYRGDFGATENAIYDISWVRLRELTLSYTLPKLNVKFLQGATVFFTGRNLWLHTKYPGVDPETSLTGAGSNVGGFDWFNMPNTKSFIFGLRANF